MTSVYKSPGVHVESAGDRFISLDAVETGVTGFLGVTRKGPRQSPVRVGSFEQYEKVFGEGVDFMSAGVRGFFDNGGRSAVIVNVQPQGGLDPTPDDFIGQQGTEWRGLRALERVEEVDLVVAPDLMRHMGTSIGFTEADNALAVQRAMIEHCERMHDRIALLDCPPGQELQNALRWRKHFDTSHAALYFPWIKVRRGTTVGPAVPPSGHIAGSIAKHDVLEGVHRAPANLKIEGLVDVSRLPFSLKVLLENLLKCPVCGSDFSLKPDNILCAKNHSFPHRGNVIDFSSVDKIDHLQTRSQESFGVEWTQYYANLGWSPKELPVETEMFLTYTRAMPNFFSNNIVIDAGCGNGRYINVVNSISSPPPRLIIGIDLADSIFVAAKNCSKFRNVVFLKVNLNLLPQILEKPVDYIYSIGVLHHTPDAKASFESLVKCVKRNGFISLYLYGKGNALLYRVNSLLRNRFFRRWPHKLVYCLVFLIAIPCQLFRIPFF